MSPVGLSPRGRGNHLPVSPGCGHARSIPAWAGEPHRCGPYDSGNKVYPRVGGGTRVDAAWPWHGPRSIPAWAGEPPFKNFSTLLNRVYPRVGGGTIPQLPISERPTGLSPRGRGNRLTGRSKAVAARSIPAWAGGTVPKRWVSPGHMGLSPRGRGNPQRDDVERAGLRSIPAWAGEPASPVPTSQIHRVYPRVGGGTTLGGLTVTPSRGLSPRGRGNLRSFGWPNIRGGSIPAWAGEPVRSWLNPRSHGVYPRVGGGTHLPPLMPLSAPGLSPRGRGNQL